MDGTIGRDGSDRDGAPDPDGSDDGSTGEDGSVGPDGSSADGGGPLLELVCDDGIDQDRDGFTDCADPDCEDAFCDVALNYCTMGMCGGCRGDATETVCGDGVDDDCDGATDCVDPECALVMCSSGAGGVVCTGGACPGCPEGDFERSCSDAMDGDCDGLIDCEDGDCMGRLCNVDGSVCMPPGMCACPGMELCQGINDDCDALVDEGCPQAIAWCCNTVVTAGSTAGTPWVGECPTGAALIGVAGQAGGTRVDQVQPICAVVRFFEDPVPTPEHVFHVRRGAPIPGTPQGATGAPNFTDQCPGDDFVIAIDGHAELGLDRFQLHCGNFSIARGGSFDWVLRRTSTVSLPVRGGPGSGDMPFNASCPGNGLVSGLAGRASTAVTQLAVTCRTLSLDLR